MISLPLIGQKNASKDSDWLRSDSLQTVEKCYLWHLPRPGYPEPGVNIEQKPRWGPPSNSEAIRSLTNNDWFRLEPTKAHEKLCFKTLFLLPLKRLPQLRSFTTPFLVSMLSVTVNVIVGINFSPLTHSLSAPSAYNALFCLHAGSSLSHQII